MAVVLVWWSVASHLGQEYTDAARRAATESGNLAQALANNVERTFAAVDQTLLLARESYARDPAHFDVQGWADSLGVQGLTNHIAFVDRNGIAIGTSSAAPASGLDLSDRSPFYRQRDAKDDALFISEPMIGRATGRMSLMLSRRINGRDGRFDGVIVAAVDPDFLDRFYQTLDVGSAGFSLIGSDGILRGIAPKGREQLGRALPVETIAQRLTGPVTGSFIGRSPIDQVARVISYRRLASLPLIVSVGLDCADVFATYEQERRDYLISASLLTACLIAVGWMLARQHHGLMRSRARLAAAVADLEDVTAQLRERSDALAGAQRLARLGAWVWQEGDAAVRLSEELAAMLAGRLAKVVAEPGRPATVALSDLAPHLHPDDAKAVELARHEALSGHGTVTVELRLRMGGTGKLDLRIEGRRETRADGGVVWHGFCQDISELKQAQAALLRSEKQRVIGQLTSAIAHDFSNLLTVVILNVESALDQLPGGDSRELRTMLELAHQAALRGGALTTQLLTYAGRQPLRPQPLDLNGFLHGTETLLARTLGPRHPVRLRLQPDLATCRGDLAQLEHALFHMALHVRDALPDGGPITVATAEATIGPNDVAGGRAPPDVLAGVFAVLCVCDGGPGDADAPAGAAFEPFVAGPAQEAGLGLSMVHGFARQSGGYVELARPGARGAAVRLYLPATDRRAAPTPDRPAAAAEWRATGIQVLVVDDQEGVLDVLCEMLGQVGMVATGVETGDAAAALLAEGAPCDLLLADIGLPGGLDGLALVRHARAMRPDLPVLLTSGDAAYPGALPADLRAAFLLKPFRRAQLQAILQSMFTEPVIG